MVHLIVAIYASPQKIAAIEHLVNRELKYAFEGPDLKGYTRPFLSRLPGGLFDIRCKREIAPLVLRDLNAAFTAQDKPKAFFQHWTQGEKDEYGSHLSLDNTRFMSRKLYLAVRFVRFCMRLKDCDRAPGEPQVKLIGWSYVWFIGAWPDAVNEKGEEVL